MANRVPNAINGVMMSLLLLLAAYSLPAVISLTTKVNDSGNQALATSNTIPDDKILKRNWSDWKDQYTEDEFYTLENNTQWYTDTLKNNPSLNNVMNDAIAKDLTVIHNFHTMIHKKDYGQEVLALIVSKQRITHTYSADEPVKRLHDWLISKYAVPSTVSEIDKRLQDMEYDKYAPLVSQVIGAYDDAAKNGVVPYELYAQDKDYWGNVSFLSFCQLDVNCSFGETDNNANTANTNFSGNILDYVYILVSYLDKMYESHNAYALTTHYTTYFFYQFTPSNGCLDGMSCPIVQYTSGTTGPVSLHFDSNGKHAQGSSMSVYAVAYDQNNYQSSHNVTFTVTVQGYSVNNYQCVDSLTGTGYIQKTQNCSIPGYSQTTPWTFFIDGTADVWSN
ncbi:hypothetical protein [Nitrososphaera viennensis]|nr:hypothetical protein [Nitrososphaera viennensis]UVS70343.1 hypothetical protein NWT39_06035 [Nitrososphaera viennensis]